ncbi:VOC family protein [Desertihabitans aurantiacus]|uniref:VOC family protein n=1 Tax=Desertihabitans aurantiacus TaxID=2282477 RepID=UPI000DF849CF|nr:VOC family protein [Desertihabitans aurantiacus]
MSTPTLWLTLQARDAPALIDWYRDVLGFVLTAEHRDGDHVGHAELLTADGVGGLMLGSHVEGREWSIPPGSAHAYVVCADPDALHERAVAAGAEVLRAPSDTDYGSREVTLRDPEGSSWTFGTYPGTGR